MPFLPFWRPQAGNILQNLSLSRRFFVCHITCLAGQKGVGWRRLHAFCRPSRPAKALLNPSKCRFGRRKIFDSYVPGRFNRAFRGNVYRLLLSPRAAARRGARSAHCSSWRACQSRDPRPYMEHGRASACYPQNAAFAPFSHAWSPASSAPCYLVDYLAQTFVP